MTLQPSISSIFRQSVAKAVSLILTLVCSVLTARYLGVYDLGILSFSLGLIGILSPISSLGSRDYLLVSAAQGSLNHSSINSSFLLEFIGTCISALLACLFLSFSSNLHILPILFASFSISFASIPLLLESVFVGSGHGLFSSYILLFRLLLNISTILIVIHFNLPLVFIALAPLPSTLFTSTLLLFVAHKQYDLRIFVVHRGELLRTFRKALPFLLSALSVAVYMRTDLLMLESLQGFASVGNYSIAVKPFEACTSIILIFSQNSFSTFSVNLRNTTSTQRYLNIYSSISLSLSALLFISSLTVLPFLFGPQYSDSWVVLRILAVGLIPFSFTSISARALEYTSNMKIQNLRLIFAMVLNVLLNLALIPSLGPSGAAIATISSYFAQYLITPLLTSSVSLLYSQLNLSLLQSPSLIMTSIRSFIRSA